MNALKLFIGLSLALGLHALAAVPPEYEPLKVDAEKLYADGSYAKAHDAYDKAKTLELPAAEARWVEFRLADTLWRSEAATQNSDTTQLDRARQQLDVLIRDIQRVEDRDRVWAEVQESLGDYYWTRRNSRNWAEGWTHYQLALDWWSGAPDIELARQRYLKIVWAIARPPQAEPYYYYGVYGNILPLDILENALKIAQTENDKAHAHYLVAMTLRNQGGDWDWLHRVPEEFEAAIKPGKTTDWYDDALYNYAQWMQSYGHIVPLKDGAWTQEPDYKKALELFRRLVREFAKGETRYWEQAEADIKNITEPQVQISVANFFLPDSEIQYALSWRNVKRVDLTLYAVDLTRDVQLAGQEERRNDWLQSIDLGAREKIKTWFHDTKDAGDYKPGSETLHLDGKLPAGAYILEARGEGKSSRDLVLVTDASLVLKTSGKQALVYVCDALAGAPIPDAGVKIWERYYENNTWHWHEASGKTSPDGIAVFDLQRSSNNEQVFAASTLRDRQAFSVGNSYYYGRQNQDWKIYATTDRPAYRPGETVQWKFIARRYDGSVYSTPSGQIVEFQINDPRGVKIKEDKATLNSFGSAWGSLDLTDTMPLGEYHIIFWDKDKVHSIGNAVLFRLEEYKLPEFKVTVQTPEENGFKKAFRLGDKVEVNIQSDYYFGGPVANASVEVIVRQDPFFQSWHPPHDYPWLYDGPSAGFQRGRFYNYGGGQILKRETLKTDAAGKASLTFDTPRDAGQDFEYRIEARVTDASRREITGSGSVRVTRQRYYVYPVASHNLYRPQDKVTVDLKALDANDQPVQTEGTVKVTRDFWYEIWLDPAGREIKGDELKLARKRNVIFPPPPAKPADRTWQIKVRGYEHEDILTRTLKTDTNGAAQLTFTPGREGYYRVAWSSPDSANTNARPAPPITAETTVWVTTDATSELGYFQGGMEIIVDKDTFRVGQTAPVMLSVPANDRYVLFTVEGTDLYSYQLVHVTGTVKLIELPIEEKHVPNIFLNAALVSDREIYQDTKEVVVPPTKNFLTVDVKSDREQYQPREEGTFTITTRNDKNEPVPAEVSFSLVDESVFYIQSDYAGDPRQFYFGEKRAQAIQTQSTFNIKRYARLVKGENDQLMDERDLELRNREARLGDGGRFYDSAGNEINSRMDGRLELSKSFNGPAGMSRLIGGHGLGGGGGGGVTFAGGMPAPQSAAPMSLSAEMPMDRLALKDAKEPMLPPPGQEPAVQVRSDFRSTILWQPDVATGRDGTATVKVKYPDSLTGWKATARAVTEGNQFGIADTNTHTKQPLIVRLQAPRFFVVGDVLTISAVINNNTDQKMRVADKLEAEGLVISGLYVGTNGVVKGERAPYVDVGPNGEARVDWAVTVTQPGSARLKVIARGDKYADAMEKTYTVYEHGIEKFISKSGKVRGDDITVKLDIPKERKPESTSLMVQVTPSMAVTMLDALPYLIDYPYGCTEQTMSRFLPAAITAKTLKDLGLKPEDVMSRVFGGIEPGSAAATHPKGKRDLNQLDDIEKQSLDRLYDFQHSDGGWGWWKEGDSDHWMTAYVVWGLSLARDAGINVKEEALRRGVRFLDVHLVEQEENVDMQAWMLHAVSVYYAPSRNPAGQAGKFAATASDNLWNRRDTLNAYTRALFALSQHYLGNTARARTLIDNLENGVKMDASPDQSVLINGGVPSATNSQPSTVIGTAHWGEDGIYWRWSDGGVEATAFALRAFLAIDPQNKLVEPVSNWLIKNRRGAQWSNTRDTAIVVLTMNDYLRVSGELSPDLDYEVFVNGHSIARKQVSGADVFNAPSQFTVDPALVQDGVNDVRIVRHSGTGPIYFAANAKYFSLEEPVTPAGNEIFVRRQYYKLAGQPTLLKGYVYDREPLNDGETVKSGDRVETIVTIEAKNNYEYLLFEDLKPAGLEAVEVRSGESLYARELKSGAVERKFSATNDASASPDYVVQAGDTLSQIARDHGTSVAALRRANNLATVRIKAGQRIRFSPGPSPVVDDDHTGRTRWVYQELRDRKVALFIDKLPQGVWEIKYDLRAEVPGQFHALPVVGHAMYVPEIRCNGQEVRINVIDSEK
jgi:uncharacterized protein YfaS (alpha-2-macroglobulin family)